jgi:hypothetical protein
MAYDSEEGRVSLGLQKGTQPVDRDLARLDSAERAPTDAFGKRGVRERKAEPPRPRAEKGTRRSDGVGHERRLPGRRQRGDELAQQLTHGRGRHHFANRALRYRRSKEAAPLSDVGPTGKMGRHDQSLNPRPEERFRGREIPSELNIEPAKRMRRELTKKALPRRGVLRSFAALRSGTQGRDERKSAREELPHPFEFLRPEPIESNLDQVRPSPPRFLNLRSHLVHRSGWQGDDEGRRRRVHRSMIVSSTGRPR